MFTKVLIVRRTQHRDVGYRVHCNYVREKLLAILGHNPFEKPIPECHRAVTTPPVDAVRSGYNVRLWSR